MNTRDLTILCVLLVILTLGLVGCTTPAAMRCTPSSDLPAVKTMKKTPEEDVSPKRLFDLFVDERSDHARDIRDYNSLYKQCVG